MTFFSLRNFVKGKIDKWELEASHPLIYNVRLDKENIAQSEIILDWDSFDKFGKVIGLNEEDSWFYSIVNSRYSEYEAYDSYQSREDFLQGFGPWYDINEENIKLLERISRYMSKKFDFSDEDSRIVLGDSLFKLYRKQIENIIDDWTYEKNSAFIDAARKMVNDDVESSVNKFGFELYLDTGIKTTVADLISLYVQYNSVHLPLDKFLKFIFSEYGNNIGGWEDYRYEISDEKYFDKDSFNRNVESNLESIISEIENNFGPDELIKYNELVDRVRNKWNFYRWYPLPKNPKFSFYIDGFVKESLKIKILLKNPQGFEKRFNVSEENFNNLLYQPELFNLEDI